jgi:cytochrome c biogenesis protein CcdA
MDAAQLSLAFTAGALAFLSPCSLPMLPAYISYYLDKGDHRGRLTSGLYLAASTVIGFLLVFVVIGIIPSLVISEFVKWVWVAEPVVGLIVITLGIATGWTSVFNSVPNINLSFNGNRLSFLAYGVAYGFASLGCSLPVFLLVVLQGAAAGGIKEILILFIAYCAGAATLIIPLTITLTLTKGLIYERLLQVLPYMKKINAAVLILAGSYMLIKGLSW